MRSRCFFGISVFVIILSFSEAFGQQLTRLNLPAQTMEIRSCDLSGNCVSWPYFQEVEILLKDQRLADKVTAKSGIRILNEPSSIENFAREIEAQDPEFADSIRKSSLGRIIHARFKESSGKDFSSRVAQIAKDPDVEKVTILSVVQALDMGSLNDPLMPKQWSLDKISAPAAYKNYGFANSNVYVFVMDTGYFPHEDLPVPFYVDSTVPKDDGV
ncbi:MAG: hypothetical protein Q7K28_00110, partial [Candidatus Wildermuthbacteria bacterium]|nr:hypothetical protein [Candidatus Wildermuthbacteria bacterium]